MLEGFIQSEVKAALSTIDTFAWVRPSTENYSQQLISHTYESDVEFVKSFKQAVFTNSTGKHIRNDFLVGKATILLYRIVTKTNLFPSTLRLML